MAIPPRSPFSHPIPAPIRAVPPVPPVLRDPGFTVPPIPTGTDNLGEIKPPPDPEPSSTAAPVILAGLAMAGLTVTAAALVAAVVISRRR